MTLRTVNLLSGWKVLLCKSSDDQTEFAIMQLNQDGLFSSGRFSFENAVMQAPPKRSLIVSPASRALLFSLGKLISSLINMSFYLLNEVVATPIRSMALYLSSTLSSISLNSPSFSNLCYKENFSLVGQLTGFAELSSCMLAKVCNRPIPSTTLWSIFENTNTLDGSFFCLMINIFKRVSSL